MLYVGIDVDKDKHDCCIVNSDGVIINDSLRICNSSEGFELLFPCIISNSRSKVTN
ncbi:IS110 family transposase [Clostridium sp. UBA7503]|uniref:IS110 family transposase n=1 Tax=Clostridium sp. UBA7503 TaxID=1946377 RepID=UPI003216D738